MFNKASKCRLSPAEIEQKADFLLSQMTLKEKVWLLNGNWDLLANQVKYKNAYNPRPIATNGLKRLGVSPIKFSDGPRGVVMGRSTCFPVSMARGASFDRALERRIGDVIGKEARAQGANFFGGVCVNLLRHPAWGRSQETYGEDPFLVGEMGVSLAQAVQEHNVIACVKHYAFNSIENSRFEVNVKADERTMHEVYLPHFKKIVQAGAASVMGAYNRFMGEQACESHLLLTEILRHDWGFEGFTISDFIFGVRDGKQAIEAGLDVEMPAPIHYQQNLLQAVQSGQVAESIVDQAVQRLLRTLLVFENTPDPQEYHRQAGRLPGACRPGAGSRRKVDGTAQEPGAGAALQQSRQTRPALRAAWLRRRTPATTAPAASIHPMSSPRWQGLQQYFGPQVEIIHRDETQVAEAAQLAKQVDCVIIIAGNDYNDEGEHASPDNTEEMMGTLGIAYRNMGQPFKAWLLKTLSNRVSSSFQNADGTFPGGDRQSLSLKPEQRQLIESVAGLNPNTVVCLVCGGMLLIEDWADRIPAVLVAWYAGMEGGTALARLLFGEVNPSGRLPFTIPTTPDHLPYFSPTDQEITYDLYHGYTLLDKRGWQPAYPFGFGLSYTIYDYHDLKVKRAGKTLQVTIKVTNTGIRDGEEAIQVYIGIENSQIERQKKLLKGFEKVAIPASATKDVVISIPLEELCYYNTAQKQWVLESGIYNVMVGPSADERTLLKTTIELTP